MKNRLFVLFISILTVCVVDCKFFSISGKWILAKNDKENCICTDYKVIQRWLVGTYNNLNQAKEGIYTIYT